MDPRPLLAALVALLALPLATAAESLGVTPAELSVDGAQRGETYLREVMLQNQFETPSTFTIEREGDTGAWARIEPADTLVVPARTNERVRLAIHVPEDAPNGAHEGSLRFVGAAKDRPDGSGFALRYAVAVPLRIEVGGAQDVRLGFADAHAPDVEAGSVPTVRVQVANEGNVRSDARATLAVLDAAGVEVARATNATRVRPGESGALELRLPTPLPEGTYRAIVTPEGETPLAEASFKVVPVGALGKEGVLRYLRHEPFVPGGFPIRVSGVFENTGGTPITRARLVGEVWQGDRLVATFTSEELTVAAGDTVDLVAYVTSPVDGDLRLVAHVVYDGFRSASNEGILVAGEAPAAASRPVGLIASLVLVGLAGAGGLVLERRSR